jgi:hypothetical protein
MGLIRYKTFSDAREDLVLDMIKKGAEDRPLHVRIDSEDFDFRSPVHEKGLYRFKTFADARRFDMQSMIENACKGRKK